MKSARLQSKLSNVTASEKKIYDAVSCRTPMTINDIMTELHSSQKVIMQKPSVTRCVNNLVEGGLLKTAGHFQFIKEGEKPVVSADVVKVKSASIAPEQEANNFMGVGIDPVKQLEVLGESLLKFVEQLEAITKAVSSSLTMRNEKQKKLENLAEALKGLSE